MPGTKYLPTGTTVTFNAIAIGGLISISTPDRARGAAETTDSGSGADRTFLPALRNAGTVNLTFRHMNDDVGQDQLNTNYAAASSAAVKSCVITLPTGHTYTFDAFVTKPPTGELGLVDDNVAVQSATLQVTGAVTISS